jgi:hypothetical protein
MGDEAAIRRPSLPASISMIKRELEGREGSATSIEKRR